MQITEVRVAVREVGKLKGFVSITIDNCFVVRGLKVIEGTKGLFVAMPSKPKGSGGEFQDVAHPINNETRAMLEDVIIAEYWRTRETRPPNGNGNGPDHVDSS